jgi:diguanylate cyclase (GGDEF)-like protein
LEKQEAMFGPRTPPEILIEINDLVKKISDTKLLIEQASNSEFNQATLSTPCKQLSIPEISTDPRASTLNHDLQNGSLPEDNKHENLVETVNENTLITTISGFTSDYKHISIVYCDVDGLLGINKVYGTHTGDEVLRVIGQIISRAAEEHKVFRLRGDQFVIVLLGYKRDDALRLGESCLHLIEQYPWSSIGLDLYVSCAFSAARLLYESNETVENLLLRAVHGVKAAKRNGSNQVVKAPLSIPSYYSGISLPSWMS